MMIRLGKIQEKPYGGVGGGAASTPLVRPRVKIKRLIFFSYQKTRVSNFTLSRLLKREHAAIRMCFV